MSLKTEEIAKFVGSVPSHDVLLIGREKTNADNIRAMTDEELAKWLFDRDLRTVNELCAATNIKNTIRYDEKKCVDNIVDWLKSPVEVKK